VSFAAVTLRIASQRVFIIVVYFVIDSVRKLLDTPSCLALVSNGESLNSCDCDVLISMYRLRT
jgi:hypothetical protein